MGVKILFDNKHLTEDTWIDVYYGRHAKERLNERSIGSLTIAPTKIKITRFNVHSYELVNGQLQKFVVKIPFSKREMMYLVLTRSYFIEDKYFVKSLWFRNKFPHKTKLTA